LRKKAGKLATRDVYVSLFYQKGMRRKSRGLLAGIPRTGEKERPGFAQEVKQKKRIKKESGSELASKRAPGNDTRFR